jgi:hypothetical protein
MIPFGKHLNIKSRTKNPTDKDVLTILYQLNRSIGNTEKAKEYKAKIDALK